MTYLLALLSAALYGAADFVGGLASRRAPTIPVVVISQAAGLLLVAGLLPFVGGSAYAPRDLMWGAFAGIAGGIGVALLYRALATGVMAIVAPVTAVCAVVIPVLAGVLSGERPSTVTLAGIVLALVAIALVSQSSNATNDTTVRSTSQARSLMLALLSGVAIGLFYLALARTGDDAGLWPLVAARTASVALFGSLALTQGRRSLTLPRGAARWAIGCGAVDMAANALYLVAARRGALSVVVTLTSLYPASTIILARAFLGERINRVQMAGILCALAAVLLIVGGEAR